MTALYNEVRSTGGCEDSARLWNPSPKCSTQARLPPEMAWVVPIFEGLLLGQHDVCPWPFVVAPAPSPPFLDRNYKTVRRQPTRRPRPLLYGPTKKIRKRGVKREGNDEHANFVLESGCPCAVVNVLFVRSYVHAPICRGACLVGGHHIHVNFSFCQ
jgi:hypothetical protein